MLMALTPRDARGRLTRGCARGGTQGNMIWTAAARPAGARRQPRSGTDLPCRFGFQSAPPRDRRSPWHSKRRSLGSPCPSVAVHFRSGQRILRHNPAARQTFLRFLSSWGVVPPTSSISWRNVTRQLNLSPDSPTVAAGLCNRQDQAEILGPVSYQHLQSDKVRFQATRGYSILRTMHSSRYPVHVQGPLTIKQELAPTEWTTGFPSTVTSLPCSYRTDFCPACSSPRTRCPLRQQGRNRRIQPD